MNFIQDQIECPIAIGVPDDEVRKGYTFPVPQSGTEDALAKMAQPQHAPVPTSETISNNERRSLSAPARDFFRAMMRPTVKHV